MMDIRSGSQQPGVQEPVTGDGSGALFVARQPIFDLQQKVFAHELLFRTGPENLFSFNNGDQASLNVIRNSLLVFGLDTLTEGKRAFINVTRTLLVEELGRVLPPEQVVLEVLETVEPDAEVIAACKRLKQAGYLLALDDFVASPEIEALVALADIVKVDFLATPTRQRRDLVSWLAPRGIQLLAEKVETWQDFREGKDLGYSYFQGFFFSRPEILSGKDIPSFKMTCLLFLEEANRPEIDFTRLSEIIRGDVSLSVKLLRYINSWALGLRCEVRSIRHALVLLGAQQLRKWACLTAVTGMCQGKPLELLRLCLVRASFCELVGPPAGLANHSFELFLTGMLSALDALLDRPMSELLSEISVPEMVTAALLGGDTRIGKVYELILAYEAGNWERVSALGKVLGVRDQDIPHFWHQSVQWASQVLSLASVDA